MGDITYLPALDCIYLQNGYCIYQENLNPGYNIKYKCQALNALEKKYDDILNRIDSFEINDDLKYHLYQKLANNISNYYYLCKKYKYVEDIDNELSCMYFYKNICILTLPVCLGRCFRYISKKENKI